MVIASMNRGFRKAPSTSWNNPSPDSYKTFKDIKLKQKILHQKHYHYLMQPFSNRAAVTRLDHHTVGRRVIPTKTCNTIRLTTTYEGSVEGVNAGVPRTLLLYWPFGFMNGAKLCDDFSTISTATSALNTVPVWNVGESFIPVGWARTARGTITTACNATGVFGRTLRMAHRITCTGQADEVQGTMRVVWLDRRLRASNAALCFNNFFAAVNGSGLNNPDYKTHTYAMSDIFAKGGVYLHAHGGFFEQDRKFTGYSPGAEGGAYGSSTEGEREATGQSEQCMPLYFLYFEGCGNNTPIQIDVVTMGEVINHNNLTDVPDHATSASYVPAGAADQLHAHVAGMENYNQQIRNPTTHHASPDQKQQDTVMAEVDNVVEEVTGAAKNVAKDVGEVYGAFQKGARGRSKSKTKGLKNKQFDNPYDGLRKTLEKRRSKTTGRRSTSASRSLF